MLHRSDERFLGFLFDRSHQVAKPEVGDVMMLRVGRCFSHGAIVTSAEPLTIIHAFRPVGSVVEEEAARNACCKPRRRALRLVLGSVTRWASCSARRRTRSRTTPACN